MKSNKKRKEDEIVILRRKKKRRRMIRKIVERLILPANIIMFVILIILIVKSVDNSKEGKEQKTLIETWDYNISQNKDEQFKEEKLISEDRIEAFVKQYRSQMGEKEGRQTQGEEENQFEQMIVCIDAGHGGSNTGAMTKAGIMEKEQTLVLAKKVKEYLESIGIHVVMTRTEDVDLSLEERRQIARAAKADVLVSIHRNMYTGNEKIAGIEAWIKKSDPYEDRVMAEDILDNIAEQIDGVENRGVRLGCMDNPNENYGMNKVEMTSMIIEVGFMSSSHDNLWFRKYNDDIAEAIARGIADHCQYS